MTNEQLWKAAYTAFSQAFNPALSTALGKKMARMRKSGKVSPEAEAQLFGFDGFLIGLGKMSLSASYPPSRFGICFDNVFVKQTLRRMAVSIDFSPI